MEMSLSAYVEGVAWTQRPLPFSSLHPKFYGYPRVADVDTRTGN
jgi:hypothetical protein